ncbi:MAG: HAMP domain-containing histidine kinase [Saprospiraceae bacterium]|jgi:signal transduction histidine kinase|nr:HAMP domain-containing histidine kinase [Saprospiraceae bacterium]MBL0023960.1 HAMP domain-containing histidine kinase [Saprospiraceae bacterium]
MTYKKYEIRLLKKVSLLFAVLTGTAWLLVNKHYSYMGLSVPVVLFQIYDIFNMLKKAQEEVQEFVEAVHYRDFSRYFNVKQAPSELQSLREGFNEINSTFKVISKEKEVQYQYLQKILELVDTGIISFESVSGDLNWMNETFKKIMEIPYLKTIHSLEKRDPLLYQALIDIRPGENRIVPIMKENRQVKLLLAATLFQTDGILNKLIACQNINEALDETEARAWQKLLSVMTHEIMNSVAPISSLAGTLKNRLLQTSSGGDLNVSDRDDLEIGLETIKRRSEGLLKFAETYRNLNKITKPNLKKVYVRDLFENLHTLMQPTLDQKKIELDIILKDPGLMIDVDINLIEQVLINLVINALEAVKERSNAHIVLSAIKENNKILIKVADNGNGISDDLIDKIFVPFFSTKKSGSGIGLSLCKQIMMLHKGNIQVQSIKGVGTAFSLFF